MAEGGATDREWNVVEGLFFSGSFCRLSIDTEEESLIRDC